MKKAIGGYFELSLNKFPPYHQGDNCIALNTARNCFEYILRSKSYNKVLIPHYICDVMLEPVTKLNIAIEFYHINELLEPILNFEKIDSKSVLLYVNYFGIKDEYITSLSKHNINLIIDNAQSFFSKPTEGVDTFYSPRKFIGVADGGYLYTDKFLDIPLIQDESINRMQHLLLRIDKSPEEGYLSFIQNDKSLEMNDIMRMSKLTSKILSSIHYEKIIEKRLVNYNFLDQQLKKTNLLQISKPKGQVPMVYPFWTEDKVLRKRLLENRIYCATYWPNVINSYKEGSLEHNLSNNIIPIPVDQRYGIEEMNRIVELIK